MTANVDARAKEASGSRRGIALLCLGASALVHAALFGVFALPLWSERPSSPEASVASPAIDVGVIPIGEKPAMPRNGSVPTDSVHSPRLPVVGHRLPVTGPPVPVSVPVPVPVSATTPIAGASASPASDPSLTINGDAGSLTLTTSQYAAWVRKHNAPPSYPRAANADREQGHVVLRARVAPDGRLSDLGIESSSGHPLLDNAALEAVRGWRFPAYQGRGETLTLRLPFRFELYD